MSGNICCQNQQWESHAIDISKCVDNAQICAEILRLAHSGLSLQVMLEGVPETIPDIEEISEQCVASFYDLLVIDNCRLFDSDYVRNMAQENTVSAMATKRLLALNAQTDDEHQQRIYELALRELLLRFDIMQGDCS